MPSPTPEAEAVAEAAESAMVASEAAVAQETSEEAAEEETAEGPRSQDVLFDLVVSFRGTASLDGITVDVTQAGADEQEKARYHHYIETGGMLDGETRQVEFVLEGLEVEEGDAFSVTLASGVPAELGAYREFSAGPDD